jgi:hypothetical protein
MSNDLCLTEVVANSGTFQILSKPCEGRSIVSGGDEEKQNVIFLFNDLGGLPIS